ncbi:MAG: DUF3825 domain-containing protein, partial [Cyanobacteria bacterium J06555_13]
MKALFKSLSRFFQRIFGRKASKRKIGEDKTSRLKGLIGDDTAGEKPPRANQKEAFGGAIGKGHSQSPSPELRQLVYQATYHLPRTQRTHAAQVGALLRKTDRSFSYEKYNYTKLIDLLESVSDLVEMEKVIPKPGDPKSAPVYYVRPTVDISQLLTSALESYAEAGVAGAEGPSAGGWVHLESVGEAIAQRTASFSAQRYGYSDFRSFIASRSDLIEFKKESPQYVRLIAQKHRPQPAGKPIGKPEEKRLASPKQPTNPSLKPKPRLQSASSVPRASTLATEEPVVVPLSQFAGLSKEILQEKVSELAAIALPERWYFGATPPADFTYPILKSYLRYTFIRLQHESKVIASPSGAHRAFNTGLVDTLLRPIYGLFQKPANASKGLWDLVFCIAGAGPDGKRLVAQFSTLPLAANYLSDPAKAFYDLSAGTPQVDWQHVVKDNMARLPLPFLEQYAPAGFTPQRTQGLTTPEFFDYKRSFIAALEADPGGYRNIVSKLEEALERTLRRTQINYTTAVPTYYPKINSIDLLLPICLVNESTVDFAIVTRREPSGKYIG